MKDSKYDLLIQLVYFDIFFLEILKESKYCRFLDDETYNKHYTRLMSIANNRRDIMKKLNEMNEMKTFIFDFNNVKNKYFSDKEVFNRKLSLIIKNKINKSTINKLNKLFNRV